MISLVKDNRMENNATLQITGRDEADKKLVLSFNQELFIWDLLSSDADEYNKQIDINNDPVIKAVTQLIDIENYWQGTATELLAILKSYSSEIPDDPNKLTKLLNQYSNELDKRNITH